MTEVWLIGGTGLVGKRVAYLLADTEAVKLRALTRAAPLHPQDVRIDFDAFPTMPDDLAACDVAISCLGSTIKKAGSWEAFARIDTDYVLNFAAVAKATGARQFIHVSSVGASPEARNKYLAMKGRTEAGLRDLDFARLDIIQPGLLLGKRSEFRMAERVGVILSPLLNPLLRGTATKYRAIGADKVSAAIADLAGAQENGVFLHRNAEIECMAE